jgi:hypothetical protein
MPVATGNIVSRTILMMSQVSDAAPSHTFKNERLKYLGTKTAFVRWAKGHVVQKVTKEPFLFLGHVVQ